MPPTLEQNVLVLLQNAALPVLGMVGYGSMRGWMADWPRRGREFIEGICCGLLAVACMAAPLVLLPGVQVDSRNAVIAVATFFGGGFAGAIAAGIAAAYRLWLGGVGAVGGAVSAAAAYLVTLALAAWLARTGRRASYRHLALLALAIGLAMLLGLAAQPPDVAAAILMQTGAPGLAIVPGAVVVLGAIVLHFDRARLADRHLAESERRLRTIIDTLPQPLSIKDAEGRLLQVNKAYETITGLRADDLVGLHMADIRPRVGYRGPSLRELYERVRRSEEPQTLGPVPVSIGDRHLVIAASGFPIRGADGECEAIGTLINDVTELIEARELLERRQAILERHQQALMEIMRTNVLMDRAVTFADAARSITEAAGALLEVEYTHVYLLDEATQILHCVDEWTLSAARHGSAPDAEMRHFRQLMADIRREQVVGITDIMDERLGPRRAFARARGAQSAIVAGIFLGTHAQGYVGFVHAGSPRQWTGEEMACARSIANLIALMLLTSRHRETLAALDVVDDAIYIEREDGRVVYANRAARALAGLPAAGGPSGGETGAFPHVPAPLATERDRHEVAWTRDGATQELELRRTKLPGGRVVTIIEDITAETAARREHDRLQAQLQQASKMEAIGRLASGIAHDFNNLLGAVIGFAQFLEQDLPPATPQRQFARRISSACHRGRELVSQILSFTRADALARRPLDLREVLQESRELLVGSLPPTIRLGVDAGDAPLVVEANESQLQQIIVNLCVNARDAMAGQRGEIAVRLGRLAPGDPDYRRTALAGRLDPSRAYARLDVSDTGSGIAAEDLPRIFEPFFTTKERSRGTGLGLAVVHGILKTCDGACSVESDPGKGTRFSIYLPLADAPAAPAAPEGPRNDPRGRERVLVVDDEIDMTDMLSIGLERLGYEVAAVNDPVEAVEAFAASPAAWDAVVTDQLMPGMQGLALARQLKALRQDVTIVLCTGLDDGTTGALARAQGIDAFFVKPVTAEEIATAIRRCRPA